MSTISKTSHPVALLIDEVLRLTPRFRSIFAAASATADLSVIEMTVLVAVVEAGRAPTVPQIGRSLGHPRQVVQRAANVLIGRGLVAATTNPDHKRAPLLVPTEDGRATKARVDRHALREADALRAAIDTVDFERLGADLRALRRAMEAYVRDRDAADGR